jgi:transposase-like protein
LPRRLGEELGGAFGESHAGAGEDFVAARQKAVQVSQKLRGLRLTKAVELMEKALEETLTYYAFPEEHWRPIRTNTTRAHSA